VSKQSQSAKRVRKSKKELARPFGENLDTKDFLEAMFGGDEGATHDRTIKTLMSWRCLHNMSLDLSFGDLQGPTHETLNLSIDLLIQSLVLTFCLS
jgi:hypothetical protein